MKNLKLWERPDNYIGKEFFDYYPLVGQHRNSSVLSRANFKAFLDILGGESQHVIIVRASHWLCGWVEELMIHKNAPAELLEKADSILEELQGYPVVDEELYQEMEDDYALDVWNNCYDLADRVELCRKYGCSIFAARHNYLPAEDTGMLYADLVTP